MTDVLLVEDDAELGKQIMGSLEKAGLAVQWIRDGDEARAVSIEGVRLIVLDLMLPGTYGLDLLKRWRRTSDVPVLVLTARNDTADKVRALELGADDYVTKPFWPEELLARVQARLRRPAMQRGDVLVAGTMRVDLASQSVTVEGRPVELTRAELENPRRPRAAPRHGHHAPRPRRGRPGLRPARQRAHPRRARLASAPKARLGGVAHRHGVGHRLPPRNGGRFVRRVLFVWMRGGAGASREEVRASRHHGRGACGSGP